MQLRQVNTLAALLVLLSFGATPAIAQDASSVDETTFAEVRADTRDLAQTLQRFGADQRDEAVDAATDALFELDNRILDLQYRIDNRRNAMSQAARTEARDSLRALQRQRIGLAEWYGGLKSESGAAWTDIRQGFSQALTEINEGWEEALREFGGQPESAS